MTGLLRLAVAIAIAAPSIAHAQQPKAGGILHMYHRENPPSMSIHEEATYSVNVSSMPIYSNLVIYDQHKAQNSLDTIQPELATSWQWSEDGKTLNFKLREQFPLKKTYSFTGDLKVYETCPRQYEYFRYYDFTPSRSARGAVKLVGDLTLGLGQG